MQSCLTSREPSSTLPLDEKGRLNPYSWASVPHLDVLLKHESENESYSLPLVKHCCLRWPSISHRFGLTLSNQGGNNEKNSVKLALTLILFLICLEVSWLGKNLLNGDSAVRVRNSLLAIMTEYDNTDWSPDNYPQGFKRERMTPPRVFTDIVSEVINADQGNLGKAITLAKHLRNTPGPGTPVQSDTVTTYYKIVQQGLGYCADYTQVFVALAHAASIPVREWAFSINNYGGGHAFIEIWEPTLENWVFIDPYGSLMAIDKKTRKPLSVFAFNQILLQKRMESVGIIPILEDRFGFRDTAQAIEFYRSGAQQFFLWWGDNIFSYEKNKTLSLTAKLSRPMEQLVAILIGEHPQIMILKNDQNRGAIQALTSTRHTAMIILYSLPIPAFLAAFLTYELFSKRQPLYKLRMSISSHLFNSLAA